MIHVRNLKAIETFDAEMGALASPASAAITSRHLPSFHSLCFHLSFSNVPHCCFQSLHVCLRGAHTFTYLIYPPPSDLLWDHLLLEAFPAFAPPPLTCLQLYDVRHLSLVPSEYALYNSFLNFHKLY